MNDRRATAFGWSATQRPARNLFVLSILAAGLVLVQAETADAKRRQILPEMPLEEETRTKGELSLVDEAIAEAAKGQSCTIVIGGAGTLAPDAGREVLSSEIPGGIPGTALVSATNSSYSLFYDIPSAFALAPAGFNHMVAFKGNLSGNGATNFMNIVAGQQIRLKKGDTNVSVNLSAAVQGASFASGQYSTEAVLRCE